VGGAPVGTEEFERRTVNDKVNEIIGLLHRLETGTLDLTLPNGMCRVQAVIRCVRLCIPSMLTHWLRCCDPAVTKTYAARLDEAVALSILQLLGFGAYAELADASTRAGANFRRRLFAPYELGGYGIMSCRLAADAAYVASWANCGRLVESAIPITDQSLETIDLQHLQPLADALQRLQIATAKHVPISVADCIANGDNKLQQLIYSSLQELEMQKLKADLADDRSALAQLESAGYGHAYTWLGASPALFSMRMNDGDFRLASALRLRLPLHYLLPDLPAVPTRCLRCDKEMDVYGDHAFRCLIPYVSRRHTAIKKAFYHEAFSSQRNPTVAALCCAELEAEVDKLFTRRDGVQEKRRSDITITSGPEHLDRKIIDFTGVHPAPDVAGQGDEATHAGAAAQRAEDRKWKAYQADYHMQKRDLIPFAIETLGAIGPAGRKLITTVANTAHPVQWVADPKTKQNLPVDYDGLRSMCIRSLRERVAVTWQKGNAILLRAWPLICVKGRDPDAERRTA